MEEMKKKEERLEKQMAEVMSENRKLTDPLQKANSEVEELRRQLANYEKDKQLLAVSTIDPRFGFCYYCGIKIQWCIVVEVSVDRCIV